MFYLAWHVTKVGEVSRFTALSWYQKVDLGIVPLPYFFWIAHTNSEVECPRVTSDVVPVLSGIHFCIVSFYQNTSYH